MERVTRRELLAAAALAGGGALTAGTADLLSRTASGKALSGPPFNGKYALKPLSFEPTGLAGMSAESIGAHYSGHYSQAVDRLNAVRHRLAELPADAPSYLTGLLKREEVRSMNSMILHELYFDGLGGGGGPDCTAGRLIEAAYGSFERWRKDFTRTALSLSGGQGWVMLAYLPRDGHVLNVWSADHLVATAGAIPLLVLDMYEHSYIADYGADAEGYVESFFRNVNWQRVEARTAAIG